MLIRAVVVAAGVACSAGALAGEVAPDAVQGSSAAVYAGPQGATADAPIETAPVSQRSDFAAPDPFDEPVSFEHQAQPALAIPAVAPAGSGRPAGDAAEKDPLNAPFWVFLFWYVGSR